MAFRYRCDKLLMDVGNSGNSGGRPMSFGYSIIATDSSIYPGNSGWSNETAAVADLQAQLDSFSATSIRNTLDLLDVNAYGDHSFDITVSATNYLSGTSNTTKRVAKSSLATPRVMINGQAELTVLAKDAVPLNADATFAWCYVGRKTMIYEWTATNLDGESVTLDKTRNTRKLVVPAFTLQPLTTYVVNCLGYMEANPDLRNEAQVPTMLFNVDLCALALTCRRGVVARLS